MQTTENSVIFQIWSSFGLKSSSGWRRALQMSNLGGFSMAAHTYWCLQTCWWNLVSVKSLWSPDGLSRAFVCPLNRMSRESTFIHLLLLKRSGRLKNWKPAQEAGVWGLGKQLGNAVFSVENCCLIGYKHLVEAVDSVFTQTFSCACSGSPLTFLGLRSVCCSFPWRMGWQTCTLSTRHKLAESELHLRGLLSEFLISSPTFISELCGNLL